MKYLALLFTFIIAFSLLSNSFAQPPEGETTKNQYDQDHVKERSKKSHKKADKITKHNLKVQEHGNKLSERDRKDKLSGKKKQDDNHQFPH